jgi:hypothetical protein
MGKEEGAERDRKKKKSLAVAETVRDLMGD